MDCADVGTALVADPHVRVISFTGSTTTGRAVGALAGRHLKRAHLELGGNSALIVLDDVDLEQAISAAAFGSYFYQGQICMSIGRHLVHDSIYLEYVRRLAAKAEAMPVGDPASGQVALATLDDAVKLASDSDYGLSLGILTADVARGLALAERIPTGIVHINDQTINDEAHVPFGGVLSSGTGARFGGAAANVEAYTETRWITARGDIARYPF